MTKKIILLCMVFVIGLCGCGESEVKELPVDISSIKQIKTVRYIQDGFPDVRYTFNRYVMGETENFYKASDDFFKIELYRTKERYRTRKYHYGYTKWGIHYVPKNPSVSFIPWGDKTEYLYEDGDRVKEGKLCEN